MRTKQTTANVTQMKEAGDRLTKAIREKYRGRKDWLEQFCTDLDSCGASTSKAMIINYRNGKNMLPVDRARVYADVLGVSATYLLAVDMPEKPKHEQKLPELYEADYLISRVSAVKALANIQHKLTNANWNAVVRALSSVPPAEIEAINTVNGVKIEIYKDE